MHALRAWDTSVYAWKKVQPTPTIRGKRVAWKLEYFLGFNSIQDGEGGRDDIGSAVQGLTVLSGSSGILSYFMLCVFLAYTLPSSESWQATTSAGSCRDNRAVQCKRGVCRRLTVLVHFKQDSMLQRAEGLVAINEP